MNRQPSKFSLTSDLNDTSTTLDLLRVLAAFAVLFGHALATYQVGAILQGPHVPYMQNIGVLVFFVLSGFLIAYSLDRTHQRGEGFSCYLIDRFARVYSAIVPSLILVGIIDWWLAKQGLHEHPENVSFSIWLGNLIMVQGYHGEFGSRFIAVPNFGSALQLWTLSIEVHLYVFFGALYFAARQTRHWFAMMAAVAFAGMPLYYFSTFDNSGSGISYLWLMGFVLHLLIKDATPRPTRMALYIGITMLAALLYRKLVPGNEYNGGAYVVLAALFALILLLSQQTAVFAVRPKIRSAIRYCADFSFTLYLIHLTLLQVVKVFFQLDGWVAAVAGIALSVVVSILLAHIGEHHYKAISRGIKGIAFGSRHSKPA